MGNKTLVNVDSPGIRSVDGGDQTQLLVQKSATTFDYKGGSGIISDRNNIINGEAREKFIKWEGATDVDIIPLLPDLSGTFPIVIDENGDLQILDSGGSSLATALQYNNIVQIGAVVMVSGSILSLQVGTFPTYGTPNAIYSLARAVGAVNSTVNPITIDESTVDGASFLRLQSNPGEAFTPAGGYVVDPTTPHSITNLNVVDPLPLIALTKRDSSFTFSATSEIDPNNYEDPVTGNLIPVSNNKYTLQHLYLFPVSQILISIYGNEEFNTLSGAVASVINGLPIVSVVATAIPVAKLAIQQGTTNFNNPGVEFQFLDVNR